MKMLQTPATSRKTNILCLMLILAITACGARLLFAADMTAWYEFKPQNTPEPGEIGMADWLEKPAGKHGRIEMQSDQLIYDGKPIKLWGLNLCYSACAPDKALAEKRAAIYPKYGVNSVRLHKYADGAGWGGIQSADSVAQFDPQALDRMDYQIAQFKKTGIFVKLSAHFGAVKIGPADVKDVPFATEFGTFDSHNKRISCPHSSFYYSPEIQNLHIRQTVNLLKHRNPYTHLTYADDPAVYVIEIINEQSILFYTSMGPLQKSPTLRNQVGARFCAWLRNKYTDHAGLLEAWGPAALDTFVKEGSGPGEHLDKNNILPLGNPWYWDPAQLQGSQAYRKQRMLDTLEFLYTLQTQANRRYTDALRKAGYHGLILGSNWQAGRAFSHYANLHADYLVGLIDRHNYFGGGKADKFNNSSMLSVPGSGMLSAGMQQVADRPFMLSEWIHVYPNEWGVEGPAIIAAYGMGLQGWDVSYMFQNGDSGGFSPTLGAQSWDVTVPQVFGIFPAIARQVLRNDVKQSDLTAVRHVDMPSIFQGKIGFDENVTQQYDVKSFDGDKVTAQTLAVARTVVAFGDTFKPTDAFDLSPYKKGDTLTSSTGQLNWTRGKSKSDGLLTINTPGTKAAIGFAKDKSLKLDNITITPRCPFAAIYVTAVDKDETTDSAKKLLVTAIARARNTGMELNPEGDAVLNKGRAPILMEPVTADIAITAPGTPKVYLLDHDGLRTQTTLPLRNGKFTINGARDNTCYYLIEY